MCQNGLTLVLLTASPQETAALAARLAPWLAAGDILLLSGQIGAGKTHFARALIQYRLGMVGLAEEVPSPTFTLVQTYQAGSLEIWHADLYRLSHPDDALELGLEEAFAKALCLIEWPDRLGRLALPDALLLHLAPEGETGRRITLAATAHRWAPVLKALGHD